MISSLNNVLSQSQIKLIEAGRLLRGLFTSPQHKDHTDSLDGCEFDERETKQSHRRTSRADDNIEEEDSVDDTTDYAVKISTLKKVINYFITSYCHVNLLL